MSFIANFKPSIQSDSAHSIGFLCPFSLFLLLVFTCSGMSDSLQPHSGIAGFPVLHHLLKLAQTHVHHVDDAIQPSHPLSVPFSSYPQSFPASGSFPMSWLFSSDCQSTGASASASILPYHGYLSTHNSYVLEDVMELEVLSNHEDCNKFFSLKANTDCSNCQCSRKDGSSQCTVG